MRNRPPVIGRVVAGAEPHRALDGGPGRPAVGILGVRVIRRDGLAWRGRQSGPPLVAMSRSSTGPAGSRAEGLPWLGGGPPGSASVPGGTCDRGPRANAKSRGVGELERCRAGSGCWSRLLGTKQIYRILINTVQII